MLEELKRIKKKYGENFAKFCRSNFSTILETPGYLSKILEKNFYPTKILYDDIHYYGQEREFINFINLKYFAEKKIEQNVDGLEGTPEELMEIAGYTLHKCETDEDVKSFMKYYREDEKICTFRDPNRIETHTIFFAVKKDAENIKRFENPERQDEYGTSVISLQFDKIHGTLSIKNRYNHTVENPDATFSNDLDNIIPGLSKSFSEHYGIEYIPEEEGLYMRDYIVGPDGRYYKCNFSFIDIHVSVDNIVIDGENITQYDKERYEIIGKYIIDKKEKTIKTVTGINDEFCNLYNNIRKIEVVKGEDPGTKKIIITQENGNQSSLIINKNNQLMGYVNHNLTEIGDSFLSGCNNIEFIDIPNVRKIGDCFVSTSKVVKINCPKLEEVGRYFLQNAEIKEVNLPCLKKAGSEFMSNSKSTKIINLPMLESVGESFFRSNVNIKTVNLPNLVQAGPYMFMRNINMESFKTPKLTKLEASSLKEAKLKELDLSSVEMVDCYCLTNAKVKSLNMPKVTEIQDSFMAANDVLEEINAPNLEVVAEKVFRRFKGEKLSLPSLTMVGNDFLDFAQFIKSFDAPNLFYVGDNFMHYSRVLELINIPKLEQAGVSFLSENWYLTSLNVPLLEKIESGFLFANTDLSELIITNVKSIGNNCFTSNLALEKLIAPNLENIGNGCLEDNTIIKLIDAPKIEMIGNSFLKNHIFDIKMNLPKLKDDGFMFIHVPEDEKKYTTLKKLNLTKLSETEDVK